MSGEGGAGQGGADMGGAAGAGTSGQAGAGGACGLQVGQFPLEPSPHVEQCLPLKFGTNPPSSGNHYGVWAAFKTYDKPIPRGFWVHSMEHGAVVLLYNCPEGCAGEVAELQGMIDAFPADPLCTDPSWPQKRLILVEDPALDVKFAAAAWGATLRSSCLDEATKEALDAFMLNNYAKAPENFCNPGVDVAALVLPEKCGEEGYVPPMTP